MTEISRDQARELLIKAVLSGRRADMDAWAEAGEEGVLLLLNLVTKTTSLDLSGADPRGARTYSENRTRAFAAMAQRHPEAYLRIFSDPSLDEDLEVLSGLAEIDSPDVAARLVSAAQSSKRFVRVQAAWGLARQADPRARETLARLEDDPDDLVRYNSFLAQAKAKEPPIPGESDGQRMLRLAFWASKRAHGAPPPEV